MKKKKQITSYQAAYISDYGFEKKIVQARQKMVLSVVKKIRPSVVIEVSCGLDLLYTQVAACRFPIKKWIIVEPSPRFARLAKTYCPNSGKLVVIKEFFEDAEELIRKINHAPVDLIIISGLLNEVNNPSELLKTARRLLSPNGVLHVNVPNAFSLHRQLGKELGLISTLKSLTERNKKLNQFQVFNAQSLKKIITNAGFFIKESGGYFLKPFSHKQMSKIEHMLTQEILDGLWMLGQKHPEFATEIFVNAKIKKCKNKKTKKK